MHITLEHAAIWTTRLDVLRSYYCTYFGGVSNDRYENASKGFMSYFISFGTGARLELMSKPGIPEKTQDRKDAQHLGLIHLAFGVDSEAEVDRMAEALNHDGYPILKGPRRTGDGYYEFETLDPDGNRLEVTTKATPLVYRQIDPSTNKYDPAFAEGELKDWLAGWEAYFPIIGIHPPWVGYWILKGEEVIGTVVFKGPPVDNRVEIAYALLESYRGKGYMKSACKWAVELARRTDPGLVITATTSPYENPSTGVLKANGFAYTRIVQDHEIGDAWEFVWKG
jgi:lactoylglutathione lyase